MECYRDDSAVREGKLAVEAAMAGGGRHDVGSGQGTSVWGGYWPFYTRSTLRQEGSNTLEGVRRVGASECHTAAARPAL
jgi:hypothetical protein